MLVLKDDGNLYHYQQENQKFLQLNISSMDFNKVLSMTIDSNNLLWIFATGNNTRCYRLNHTGKSVTHQRAYIGGYCCRQTRSVRRMFLSIVHLGYLGKGIGWHYWKDRFYWRIAVGCKRTQNPENSIRG